MITQYMAIDPGASGGIAWTEPECGTNAIGMPDTVVDIADHLRYLFIQKGCRTAFLEEIPKFAGPNGAAMIKLGIRYGEIRGILATLGLKVVELPPKLWQKTLGLGGKATHGTRWKAYLKEKAQAYHPQLTVTLKTADALLILEAGLKTS